MITPRGTQPQTNSSQSTSTSNIFSILAIVLGVVAVLFLPIVFGIAAIVLAGVALSKKERLAMVVAAVGTVAGFVLGAIVYSSRDYHAALQQDRRRRRHNEEVGIIVVMPTSA